MAGVEGGSEGRGRGDEGVEHGPVARPGATQLGDRPAAGVEGVGPGRRIGGGAESELRRGAEEEQGIERARCSAQRLLQRQPQRVQRRGRIVERRQVRLEILDHRLRASCQADAEVAIADGLVQRGQAGGGGDEGLRRRAERRRERLAQPGSGGL